MTLNHIDRKVHLVQSLLSELKIAKLDIPVPYSNIQLFCVEILNVHTQEAVEQTRDKAFKHVGDGSPLPWPGIRAVREAPGRVSCVRVSGEEGAHAGFCRIMAVEAKQAQECPQCLEICCSSIVCSIESVLERTEAEREKSEAQLRGIS